MENPGSFAVITTFTPDFYDDFMLFYESLRRVSSIPLVVIPVECDRDFELPSELYPLWLTDDEQKYYRQAGKRWMQWFKPKLIKIAIERCDLDTVLWLDADLIVQDDIQPLFSKACEDFLVMRDNFAPLDCLNDDQLYEKYPCPVAEDVAKIALNSGVIGIQWPRDQKILDAWEEKTMIAVRDAEARECISLYDQGTLLWAMRELGVLDKVIGKPEWNHNAKRNLYETEPQFRWPYGQHMGGDLADQIRYDNPGQTIVHYAGLPKLSHLCKFNAQQTHQYRKNIHGNTEPTHVFGIGLERAGTHTLAEMLRRSSRYGCWVRHEYSQLSYAAHDKWKGENVDAVLGECFKVYNRLDAQLISEVNHRLSFFVPEIKECVRNSYFFLLLRNPIDLVRSRLRNFSCWHDQLHKFPGFYQFDVYSRRREFGVGSHTQNRARIRPEGEWSDNPIEMHVWEIVETLRFVLRDLRELPETEYRILWIENLHKSMVDFQQLIPKRYIDWSKARPLANTNFGQSPDPSSETMAWIEEQIVENADFILHNIVGVLQEYGVRLYEYDFV